MAKNDMQKIWKRWNARLRIMKKLADAEEREGFLSECKQLQESLDRFETKELQTESDGAKNLNLFDSCDGGKYAAISAPCK